MDKRSIRRQRYEKRKASGTCVKCAARPAMDGLVSCEICSDREASQLKRRRQKRVEKNLCKECGGKVVDRGLCEKHLAIRVDLVDKVDNTRSKRLVDGRCFQCNGEAVVNPKRKYHTCETCYLKVSARNHFGTSARWQELRDLFDNQSVCPYTGKKLALSINTTLDHKEAMSKGGSDDISNFQWVYADYYGGFDVNRMKGSLTDSEYKEAIKNQYEFLFG